MVEIIGKMLEQHAKANIESTGSMIQSLARMMARR